MLIVVRHGRTAANAAGELLGRRDPPLDAVGEAQALAIAEAIKQPVRVISSPLRRCRETAAAISATVEVDDRLTELNYGVFEGKNPTEISTDTWQRWRARSDWHPEGGESHDDLAARVWPALDDLAPHAAHGDIVLVSHVSPIKAAVAWSLGVGIDISWRCFIAQAAIVRISTAGNAPSLQSMNETTHLDGLR